MRKRLFVSFLAVALLGIAGGIGLASASSQPATRGGWAGAALGLQPATQAQVSDAPPSLAITTAQTIRRIWRPSSFREIDHSPRGLSVGDEYVFGGPLYNRRETRKLGWLSGHCTFTNPRFRQLAECEVTSTPNIKGPSLALGNQITAQGWNDNTPYPFKNAVNGGTGIYQNVRGQMVVSFPDGKILITYHLIP